MMSKWGTSFESTHRRMNRLTLQMPPLPGVFITSKKTSQLLLLSIRYITPAKQACCIVIKGYVPIFILQCSKRQLTGIRTRCDNQVHYGDVEVLHVLIILRYSPIIHYFIICNRIFQNVISKNQSTPHSSTLST